MNIRGTSMGGKLLLPLIALSSAVALPAAAQQSGQHSPSYNQDVNSRTAHDDLRVAAANLNAQRGELFRKRDVAGVAALYTPDATYIELLPRLDVMHGRAQIQGHFKDLLAANVADLVPNVTTAEMMGEGAMLVGGDYSLTVATGKKVSGHFFQILRQERGGWRIALHAFARPEPVTPVEASQYNVSSGG